MLRKTNAWTEDVWDWARLQLGRSSDAAEDEVAVDYDAGELLLQLGRSSDAAEDFSGMMASGPSSASFN